jgi:hypothetical protein
MFRKLTTTDPKKARRAFLLLVIFASFGVAIAVFSAILREWLFLAIWLIAEADMIASATSHYTVGWPGSRVESYGKALSRVSSAQRLLAGLVFLIATLLPLWILPENELILGLTGLVIAVWVFRLTRAVLKEGWRGEKSSSPRGSG